MNLPEVKNQQKLGKLGESIAAKYLQKHGYSIIERNFHTRYGEIDIIATKHAVLVFVEVKTRTSTAFGTPEEAVTPRKLAHIQQAARAYATGTHMDTWLQRIDVIGILVDVKTLSSKINHRENCQ